MIGQGNLQSQIEQLIENRTFPRFSIFVGPKGSGKKTFVHCIYKQFGHGLFANIGIGVDDIRKCIAQSYTVRGEQTIYLLADADNMSNAAKNALLKVTEEPPNNAYFIMTLEDENNTLETIRSRGTVFHMDRYTPDEILDYSIPIFGLERLDSSTRQIITDLCETPGDVNILNKCNIYEFYDYVQLVVNNINKVPLANAFKIAEKISLKADADGYDLKLFWKSFQRVCLECCAEKDISPEQILDYGEWIRITSKCLNRLKVRGINKQMLFDTWILLIREGE